MFNEKKNSLKRNLQNYPKKSRTSATWSASSSTVRTGTLVEIGAAPNCNFLKRKNAKKFIRNMNSTAQENKIKIKEN